MAIQTNYAETQPAGVAGAQATMIPATMISRNVEDEAAIGFGVAVAQGAEDKGCKAFGTGDTAVLGITIVDRSAKGADGFGTGDSARIMTKGDVWVTASVAVDAGDPVWVVPATGAFAKTNASSAVQIAGARWDTSTTAGDQLAVVRLG